LKRSVFEEKAVELHIDVGGEGGRGAQVTRLACLEALERREGVEAVVV
jgi:hypothetical protein